MEKPRIIGDWKNLLSVEKHGNYVNDHTIVQDKDGKWHLFGITSFTGIPAEERYFVHATSETLFDGKEMIEENRVIDDGTKAWAPCVIENQGKYYMYYGPSPSKLAISSDMNEWMGYPLEMVGEPEQAAHRDHMVLKINQNTWVMYVTGLYEDYSCLSCFVSNDLIQWRFVQYALTSSDDAPLNPAWGAFESPYVVKRGEHYYLFVTYTDSSDATYSNTLVFESTNPYDFGNYTLAKHQEMVVAEIKAHAPEIIRDKLTGDFYITTCGWTSKDIPNKKGVAIAKLIWEK